MEKGLATTFPIEIFFMAKLSISWKMNFCVLNMLPVNFSNNNFPWCHICRASLA